MQDTQDPRYGTVDEDHFLIGAVMNDDGGWERPRRARRPRDTGAPRRVSLQGSRYLQDESRFPRLPGNSQLFGAPIVIVEEINHRTRGLRRLATFLPDRCYIPGIMGEVLQKGARQWSREGIDEDSEFTIVKFGSDTIIVPKRCLRHDIEKA